MHPIKEEDQWREYHEDHRGGDFCRKYLYLMTICAKSGKNTLKPLAITHDLGEFLSPFYIIKCILAPSVYSIYRLVYFQCIYKTLNT